MTIDYVADTQILKQDCQLRRAKMTNNLPEDAINSSFVSSRHSENFRRGVQLDLAKCNQHAVLHAQKARFPFGCPIGDQQDTT